MKVFYKFLLIGLLVLNTDFIVKGQKDKPRLVGFNTNNEVVIGYKSGTIAKFSVPNLEIIKEIKPDDRKNKTSSGSFSPKGNRLVIYDKKVKKLLLYNAQTLEEITRFENKTWNYTFFGDDKILIAKDIYDLKTGEKIKDISYLEGKIKYGDFKFSPSAKLGLNFNSGDMLGMGGYTIYDMETGQWLREGELGVDNSGLTENSRFIGEDSVYLESRVMATQDASSYNLFAVNDKDFVLKENAFTQNVPQDNPYIKSSNKLTLGNHGNHYTNGSDIYIPLGSDYSFNYGYGSISPDQKWTVLVNKKGEIRLYDLTEMKPIEEWDGDYEQPTEVKRVTIEE
ncbi:hypothetical protein [Marivirga sp.]|uniref:hypothetical protein n=1 Tax=Marivirga sp. TaxID=2018662 RepID=UPI003DA76BEB